MHQSEFAYSIAMPLSPALWGEVRRAGSRRPPVPGTNDDGRAVAPCASPVLSAVGTIVPSRTPMEDNLKRTGHARDGIGDDVEGLG